jgi:hypothetical protein
MTWCVCVHEEEVGRGGGEGKRYVKRSTEK